jgi:3'(2'), 5'-bisphosphate nucleotidase
MYDTEIKAIREAARLASRLTLAVREAMLGSPEAIEKAGREPVTVADFGAQAVILKVLSDAFPQDGVIAEEKGADFDKLSTHEQHGQVRDFVSQTLNMQVTDNDIRSWLDFGRGRETNRIWTVDPIDGTKGFIRGDQYAIAIALLLGGEVQVSALACPAMPFDPTSDNQTGAIALAMSEQGVILEPLDDGGVTKRMHVTTDASHQNARVVESVEKAHTDHDFSAKVLTEAGIGGEPVRIDSQAKYLAVADGRAEIYIRNSRGGHVERIWDHAAGYLVVKEAGGTVTDLNGDRLDFSRGNLLERNHGILATNGHVHDALLEAIAAQSE